MGVALSAVAKVTLHSPGLQVSWNIFESIIVAISLLDMTLSSVEGVSVVVSVASSDTNCGAFRCSSPVPLPWLTVSSLRLSLSLSSTVS